MRFRSLIIPAAALAVTAGTAVAQTAGTVELNGFASYTKLSKSRSLQDDLHGAGGRLGFFFTDRWELEGELDDARVKHANGTKDTYMPIVARLNYNIPFSSRPATSFLLGVGAQRSSYAGLHDYGPAAIAGLRVGIVRWLAVRGDVGYAYLTSPKTSEVKGTIGLSLLLGGRTINKAPIVVSLTPASATLQPGQTQQLTASAMQGDQMLTRTYTCTSSDAAVATVDSNRVVTAVAPGTATITCTTGTMSATSTITVVAPPPPPAPVIDSSAILRARQDSIDAANAAMARGLVIYFDFDKSAVRPDAKAIMDSLIVKAKAGGTDVSVLVEGHTDNRGSDEYNLALGQRRANAAKRYMVANGIPASKITIRSFGEECPVVPNATTEDEHQQNRRDEFVVTIAGNTMQAPSSAAAKSCTAGSGQ